MKIFASNTDSAIATPGSDLACSIESANCVVRFALNGPFPEAFRLPVVLYLLLLLFR